MKKNNLAVQYSKHSPLAHHHWYNQNPMKNTNVSIQLIKTETVPISSIANKTLDNLRTKPVR